MFGSEKLCCRKQVLVVCSALGALADVLFALSFDSWVNVLVKQVGHNVSEFLAIHSSSFLLGYTERGARIPRFIFSSPYVKRDLAVVSGMPRMSAISWKLLSP